MKSRYVKTLGAVLVTAPALFLGSPAGAAGPGQGYVTGQELSEACNKGTQVSLLFCQTHVMGAVDAVVNFDRVTNKTSPHFCLPEGVRVPQMIEIVKDYLRENQADLGDVAGEMVDVAISRAFPCSQN